MVEQVKNGMVALTLALLAFLKPIGGEMASLLLVFVLNFLFGYLSGMIAHGEDFSLKKAVVCIGHATCFFVLCVAVYAIGRMKGQMGGAVQCVSFITYMVLYFYGLNILRNMRGIFREGTPPWRVADALYWILRLKFVERIPGLDSYLNRSKDEKDGKEGDDGEG